MKENKRKRLKLGDVYAIPLPNDKYAFGRTFEDASIAIYQHIGETAEDLPKTEDYQFTVGVYEDILKSGQWPIVDSRPFRTKEEAWPPPTCIIDKITGDYSIYYRGVIRKSNESECDGLEEAAVWESEHIIDRIMGDDKWHRR